MTVIKLVKLMLGISLFVLKRYLNIVRRIRETYHECRGEEYKQSSV